MVITVDGTDPTTLGSGDFTYGLVPAGTYTIAATQGGTTYQGTVTIGAGQYWTVLVYLTHPSGAVTINGFLNDQTAVPVNQSRIVIRNTANVGAVDVYINGIDESPAGGLVNGPNAKVELALSAPSQITIEVVLHSAPEDQYITAETGVLSPGSLLNVFVVGDSTANPSTIGLLTNNNPLGSGYRLYAADGGVFDFHNAGFFGSMGGMHLNQPIVGASPTSLGLGYWLVASDGGIFSFGDAGYWGSTGNIKLNKPVVGMAPTNDSGGYWLAASDGGIFSFGDAHFQHGSLGATHLNKPIVGIAATPDGHGYWMVASDGGVFSFGDADFFGIDGAARRSTSRSWPWCPRWTVRATGWWPQTAGSSPSGMPPSSDRWAARRSTSPS